MYVSVGLVKELTQEDVSKEVYGLKVLDFYLKEIEHLINFVFLGNGDQDNVNFEEIKIILKEEIFEV